VNEYEPVVVGVPDNNPDVESMDNPLGNVPALIDQANGIEPVAENG
jgi:hypothetical protein